MRQFPVQTKSNQGYALIEILLAFGLSIVIILAMVTLANTTVRAATSNNAYAEAGKIAQGQVERLKLFRATNPWSTFSVYMQDCIAAHCYIDPMGNPQWALDGVHNPGSSEITYYFTTSANSPGYNYTVVVTWHLGSELKTYTIEGFLSDWSTV